MFFETKKEAFKYAAVGIALASIPVVNLGVALAIGMANDAGKMDEFENNLRSAVYVSAVLWVPALAVLPFALAYLFVDSVIDLFENLSDKKNHKITI